MGFLSSVAGNLTGGIVGTSDTEKAASEAKKISKKAAKKTLGELDESWGDIEGWLNPYIETGAEALGVYKEQIGAAPDTPVFDSFDFDYTKMEDNPAYQFVREQGMQAVDRLAAKNRNLGSGNRMTAMADYTAGLASTEYGNEFQRQLQSSQYNNRLRQQGFENERGIWGTQLDARGEMAGRGQTAATNAGSFRERLATSRGMAYGNRAAEVTAANMLPVQEKMDFINSAKKAAGMMAGGM